MQEENKRTTKISFRVNDEEKQYIENKFSISKYKFLSDFLRSQAICGAVIFLDNLYFDDFKRQLAGACNNINQLAFQANKNGSVSPQIAGELEKTREEISDLFEHVELLRELVNLELQSGILDSILDNF